MAAPHKVYAKKVWINFTTEQLQGMEREALLTGSTVSEVVRRAMDAYLATPAKQKRGLKK